MIVEMLLYYFIKILKMNITEKSSFPNYFANKARDGSLLTAGSRLNINQIIGQKKLPRMCNIGEHTSGEHHSDIITPTSSLFTFFNKRLCLFDIFSSSLASSPILSWISFSWPWNYSI